MNAEKKVVSDPKRQHASASVEAVPPGQIESDRDLLEVLGMGDAEAAMFLGKSRQALNAQLGPRKGRKGKGPDDYFKFGDILILVSAARQMGRDFSVADVRAYVERSRAPRDGIWTEPYRLLMDLLGEELVELDATDADTVVLVLPTLNDLLANQREIADRLKDMVRDVSTRREPAQVFLLASTMIRAKTAGQWLGIAEDHCFGRDLVDHYLPTVIIYRQDIDEPRPYVLTEKGRFTATPRFAAHMLAACVRSMMPGEMQHALQPAPAEVEREAVAAG